VQIRLCDKDRERFKVDEWLEADWLDISIVDLEELSVRFGFDPDDWPEPFVGALTLEQAGNPDAKPKPPRWQPQAAVWMLLRQNGVDASWDDAGSAHWLKIQTRRDPGKDPAPSPSSETSTTTPSASSST
jgi:hypothetical protein